MAITYNRRWTGARASRIPCIENIKFLGHVSDSERSQLMTKALCNCCSPEDYGLVPVEANASGTPVIAYGAGGVLDTHRLVKQEFFQTADAGCTQSALFDASEIAWDGKYVIMPWANSRKKHS